MKRILFDLSVVEEMSTAAIGTLIRFKNTIVHLEKAKVKGEGSKSLEGRFSRSLSWLLRFGSAAGQTLLAVLLGTMLGQIALAQTPKADPFPSLAELEQMLAEAPTLRAIEVEMERQRMEGSWGNRVFVYANHSQSFSSFVPFIPLDDFGVAGGTTVGVSVSVTLDRLLGKPTPADLDQRLKVLEYERLFQEKLVSLRTLFRQREKLISHLEYLQMQRRTADLQLEKVQIGLSLVSQVNGSALPFVFDPIDLAQAEEGVERIKSERRQTELEIENSQTEILGLLGKGRIGP